VTALIPRPSRVLFDAVERSLKGTSGERLIPSLYRGVMLNVLRCLKCGSTCSRPTAIGTHFIRS
jgi:hypothetical protein